MASKPLTQFFGGLLGGRRDTKVRPTETVGHIGTAIYGGFVVSNEVESSLQDRARFQTFSQILANCSIVAASTRYFLNLIGGADWSFVPADHPRGSEYADLAEEILTIDPYTPFARQVRRAAMYRFYGFSIQEWTARRRADGILTLRDVAARAQITIERWDLNLDGTVNGVVQRNPQDQQEVYLPRGKIVYLVDDSLNDSPEGLGLFRHVVESARRLERYEQLEGFGFESDLRGIPIGRAPYSELAQRLRSGEITIEQAREAVAPLENFIKNHIKKPDLGLMMDSTVFTGQDEERNPSATPKFDLSLLTGSATTLPDAARAIERVNREIARVLGTESLLLGSGEGSLALARDKTHQFALVVDAALVEIGAAFRRDLLDVIWKLNGWDPETRPELTARSVSYRDVEQVARSLREMSLAGAVLPPDDPAINEVRALLGLSPQRDAELDYDASLLDDPSDAGSEVRE